MSYCIGLSVAGSLQQQNLGALSPEVIGEAIKDVFEGNELKHSYDDADGIIQNYLQSVMAAKFEGNKTLGSAFLTQNGARDGVTTLDSGLQFEVVKAGEGERPTETSSVTVHYHGTLIDGTVFDSSIDRGQPATFGVTQVIKGWTEALQLMPKGSTYRLFIPEHLAYGATPHPGGPIEPFMTLIFDVELLEIA